LAERLLDYIAAHAGQRGGHIYVALGGEPVQMGQSMKALLEADRVRTTGAKRGMAYFLA
jgi:hypothetical protein